MFSNYNGNSPIKVNPSMLIVLGGGVGHLLVYSCRLLILQGALGGFLTTLPVMGAPSTVSGWELRANTPRAAVAKGMVETHLAQSLQEDCDPHELSRHSCGGDGDIPRFPRHQQSPLFSTYIVLFCINNCSWILSSWWFSAIWHFLVKHSSYIVWMCQE